ncbi:hypothetical protein RQP46_003994 [Phenoliferia psychrophenolica]
MSTGAITSIFPSGLSLLGGIPTKNQDFAASIVFAVLYAALIPVAFLRVLRPDSRCMALLRPFFFVQIRLVTFIIRAIQAKGNYSTGLFIAEQVLLLAGFVFLCEPLVTLSYHHIARYLGPYNPRTKWVFRGSLVLQIALFGAIALAAAAGSQYGDLSNPSTLNVVKACRDANAAICLAIVVIVQFTNIIAYLRIETMPLRQTFYLMAISNLLTITSVYKIVLYNITVNVIGRPDKIEFYLLAALPELVAVTLLLGLNVKKEFVISETDTSAKGGVASPAITMGQV